MSMSTKKRRYSYFSRQLIMIILCACFLYYFRASPLITGLSFNRLPLMNQQVLMAKTNNDVSVDTAHIMKFVTPLSPLKTYVKQAENGDDSQVDANPPAVEKKQQLTQLKDKKTLSIFLYTTHNRESFLPEIKQEKAHLAFSDTVNIQSLLPFFQQELIDEGFDVYLDQTDYQAILKEENLTYQKSYDISRRFVKQAIEAVPDLTFSFDLHRDSNRKKTTTIDIDGESHAKLLFVIGKDHPDYLKNKSFADSVSKQLNTLYPGLSRGVKLLGGEGRNGVYNQDLSPVSLLIEVGGVDNSLTECQLSLKKLAGIIRTISE